MQKPDTPYGRFIRSDRAVLILCISIALIFWTITRLSQTYKTTQECSLTYQVPEDYILASDAPEKLVVTMEGVGWDLMTNYFRETEGNLSLKLNTNRRQIYNSNQLIGKLTQTQSSIDIMGLNVDLLELIVEEKVSKKVPVILMADLTFDPRYQLKDSLAIVPDSINVMGPASRIDSIIAWPSASITLENIDKNTILNVGVVKPKEKNLFVSPEKLQLSLEVEQLTEKDFFVPVLVKNAPDSITIFPNKIKISCVVGLSHYEKIGVADFTLEVDMTGIAAKEENNTLPVILSRQPEAVKAVYLSNQSVEFFFVEETTEERIDQ